MVLNIKLHLGQDHRGGSGSNDLKCTLSRLTKIMLACLQGHVETPTLTGISKVSVIQGFLGARLLSLAGPLEEAAKIGAEEQARKSHSR